MEQDADYQEAVLPGDGSCAVVSIEAASTFGWERFSDLAIGLDHFGASAPYKVLAEEFGFTPEGVVAEIKEYFDFSGEDDCGCGDDDCGCGHGHDDCGCGKH